MITMQWLFRQQRLFFMVMVLACLVGAVSLYAMARQEDPSFPYRTGLVTVTYPGAQPAQIERRILAPLEEELADVEAIKFTRSTARTNVALVRIELHDDIYATSEAWERVRQAIDRARLEFPDGVQAPELDDRIIGIPTAIISVTGAGDILDLQQAAENLRKAVLTLDAVARVDLEAEIVDEIVVAINDAIANRLGLAPADVADQLARRNNLIPGGVLRVDGSQLNVTPVTEFENLDLLTRTQIRLPAGNYVPLGSVAEVFRAEAEPRGAEAWQDGERAVVLSIVTRRGQTDAVAFGHDLRALLSELRGDYAPIQIEEMFFQPDQVEARLDKLLGSLLLSALIICAVVLAVMGLRMGLLVSAILPLVTLITLGLYDMGGGILHQIAVIGMVISLGVLIDNAIVVVESIQVAVNHGRSAREAALDAIGEMGRPIFTATGTTLAAFLPLLLAKGDTADFTRGIPIMIMLSLSISFVIAVTFTPLLASRFIVPAARSRGALLTRFGKRLGNFAVRRPGAVLVLALTIVGASASLAPGLKLQFFPYADRALVVIDLALREGTHISTTRQASLELEYALRKRPEVTAVHRFTGFSGPRFYYNLLNYPDDARRARLAVMTSGLADNAAVMAWVRNWGRNRLPDAELVTYQLAQGPARRAPVEMRIYNADPAALSAATELVFRELRRVSGTIDVRHDLSLGTPGLRIDVNDAVAERFGVNRSAVATAIYGRTRGLAVNDYRQEDDPVPIIVRSPEGEYFPTAKLNTMRVGNSDGNSVPLMQVANLSPEWQPSAIYHRNQARVATVLSELEEGHAFNEILAEFDRRMTAVPLPAGTRIEYGGDLEGSGDANLAILKMAPLGVGLLLFFLLLHFNSFRRVGIVLLTVPLAAVGIIPGLYFSGSPFGFQSLLGVIALTGIVVNNAIVLLDRVDANLAREMPLADAVAEAVTRRTQPILLTTATTVAGLLPLAFSTSTLWPPMAWAIISGLLASTVMSLLVIPAACRVLLTEQARAQRQSAPAQPALGRPLSSR